jgi:hypothetical protein
MKMVCAMVAREMAGGSVKREDSIGDPVGKTPDNTANICRIIQIRGQGIETEDNIARAPVPIRCAQRHERAAVGDNLRFDALRAAQRETFDRPTINDAKRFDDHAHQRAPCASDRLRNPGARRCSHRL